MVMISYAKQFALIKGKQISSLGFLFFFSNALVSFPVTRVPQIPKCANSQMRVCKS